MTTNTIKKTRLHQWHLSQGAMMADFGGYEMPLWYASAKNEHLAVLQSAGLFDTSHMAAVTVSGPGAFQLLQRCFTNDMAACIGIRKRPLSSGRCVYGAFLNPHGGVLDDAIVFMVAASEYFVVVNAGMGGQIAHHLADHANNEQVHVTDHTDMLGKVDVQGPAAAKIVASVIKNPDLIFDKMPYFSFKGHFTQEKVVGSPVQLKDGKPLLLSRTGYTGELGFELFVDVGAVTSLWSQLITAGESFGLQPCGLAARDSLRGGAVLPLSHQDIGPWPFINHPWEFALPFDDEHRRFTKTFLGSDALLNLSTPRFTYPFVGFDLRKVSLEEDTAVLNDDGDPLGKVLTCVTDMGIGRVDKRVFSVASADKPADFAPRGLCCGFIKVARALSFGTKVWLKDRRRKLAVEIVQDIRPDRSARRPLAQVW